MKERSEVRFGHPAAVVFASALICGLIACKGNVETEAAEESEPTRRFLTEPAGVAPSSLEPAHTSLSVYAAADKSAIYEAIQDVFGTAAKLPDIEVDTEATFLSKYAAWYLPLSQLRGRVQGTLKSLPKASAPTPASVPIVRAWLPAKGRSLKGLGRIHGAGARGTVDLWFPLEVIRARLQDGAAGLWRGLLSTRDALSAPETRFGGTPTFVWAVVGTADQALLDSEDLAPFSHRISLSVYAPDASSERAGLVELLPDAPSRPTLAQFPPAWTARFIDPDGQPAVWLKPKSRSVAARSFSDAVESLVPLTRQGATVWIVIGLPIAQPHLPAKH